MKRITATLMMCCLFPGVGYGYKLYGHGNSSCGEWLSKRKSDDYLGELAWIQGWVSAAGRYRKYELKDTDADSMAAYVDKYCRQNPLLGVNNAAHQLVEALTPVQEYEKELRRLLNK